MIYILLWFWNINIITRYRYLQCNTEKDNIFIYYYLLPTCKNCYGTSNFTRLLTSYIFYFYTTIKHIRNSWPSDIEWRFSSSSNDLEFSKTSSKLCRNWTTYEWCKSFYTRCRNILKKNIFIYIIKNEM